MRRLMSHWENSVEIILGHHTGRTKLSGVKRTVCGAAEEAKYTSKYKSEQAGTHTMLFGQLALPSM